MFEEREKPLRELAASEPLEKRLRLITDLPAEVRKALFDAMPQDLKDLLTAPAQPVYTLDGAVYRLTGTVSNIGIHDKNRILEALKTIGIANGIKMVRVSIDDPNEATLEVHFFNANYLDEIAFKYKGDYKTANQLFPISGGARLRAGDALGQVQVDSSPTRHAPAIRRPDPPVPGSPILYLAVRPVGDYSTYTLEVRASSVLDAFFDPLFSEISFKFRPGCFNTNCEPVTGTLAPRDASPAIDYLAKDYGSFRGTMIAAMMERVPEWEPTSEADLDMVLADLFSVAADELSDYQDRVMNEAYLSSARKRVSVARHARLMDYHIHQGNQASTWLALEIDHDKVAEKRFDLLEGVTFWAGESEIDGRKKEADTSEVFLSRHEKPQVVHQYLNNIGLYTWSDTITTLKAGSTSADLLLYNTLYLDGEGAPVEAGSEEAALTGDPSAAKEIASLISAGDIKYLLLEEHLNPRTGNRAGRDPKKRQLLRLLSGEEGATVMHDPVTDQYFVRVRWEKANELRSDYCFVVNFPSDADGTKKTPAYNISLFHGNLVQVFHGRREITVFLQEGAVLRPENPLLELHYEKTDWGTLCRLPKAPLAYRNTLPGGEVPPVSTLRIEVARPGNDVDTWDERPSLIHSDDSAEMGDHFIVETDENRRSTVRFGNGKNGMKLPDGTVVFCTYQYGEPLEGNTGADTIINFDDTSVFVSKNTSALKLRSCWNPLDVTNGRDPEPVVEIIRRVPEAFRQQQRRAVTLKDYVARAEKIEGVSRAAARYAWTGSWRTVRVTIDPAGTNELSEKLAESVESYLNAVRLIGEDVEVRPPVFVPLEIVVKLCAARDVWPEESPVRFGGRIFRSLDAGRAKRIFPPRPLDLRAVAAREPDHRPRHADKRRGTYCGAEEAPGRFPGRGQCFDQAPRFHRRQGCGDAAQS